MIGTCWFTAVLNAVFSTGYAEEAKEGAAASGDAVAEKVLRYGIFDVRPTIQGGVLFDDNIFTSPTPGMEDEDLIWYVTPGITLGAGDYQEGAGNLLLMSYAPRLSFFTHNSSENSVDHEAKISGRYLTGPWTFSLQQTYLQTHDNVVDAGTRVDRDFWVTSGSAKYELSPKTLLDVFGSASFNEYEGYERNDGSDVDPLCYNEYVGGVGADYLFSPKVWFGPAFRFGSVQQKDAPDQNYQQFLLRGNYQSTEKLKFVGSAGVELRHFQGSDAEDSEVNPVFEFGVAYRASEPTTLSLDGYRREQPSTTDPEANYSTMGVSGGVSHTFRQFYTASVRAGYEHLDYTSRRTTVADPDREDDYFFARFGFDFQPQRDLTVGIWYQYRQNDSDDALYEFDNNQVGLSFAYRF
ncbi:MAG TPA: outer membrane beta-barrel protein [Methylomirabilota bacterium]|nr:outer membrane beta-barrel protein [Methylomirabilota bacterium]